MDAINVATQTAKSCNSFGPYMLVNATVQTLMGFSRRKDQDTAAELNEYFQEEMNNAKRDFQNELEAEKAADLRVKMRVAREYRLKEKFEGDKLKELMGELKVLLDREFPLKDESIPIIVDTIEEYRSLGYGVQVPLNIVLLHTLEKIGIDYDDVASRLEMFGEQLGNVKYRRWCDKDVARNAALFNLHAILGNIPTLVISPYYKNNMLHFNASMWDAQCESKPMIRPLFSIACDPIKLTTKEGKNEFQNNLTMISSVISGCARDSYSVFAHGLKPVFPKLLKENKQLLAQLSKKENKVVMDFLLNEYKNTIDSLLSLESLSKVFTDDEKKILIAQTQEAVKIIDNL